MHRDSRIQPTQVITQYPYRHARDGYISKHMHGSPGKAERPFGDSLRLCVSERVVDSNKNACARIIINSFRNIVVWLAPEKCVMKALHRNGTSQASNSCKRRVGELLSLTPRDTACPQVCREG